MVRRLVGGAVLVWFFFQVNHFALDGNGLHWFVDGRWQGVCQQLMKHCDHVFRFGDQ
jgi:hypothetical protein